MAFRHGLPVIFGLPALKHRVQGVEKGRNEGAGTGGSGAGLGTCQLEKATSSGDCIKSLCFRRKASSRRGTESATDGRYAGHQGMATFDFHRTIARRDPVNWAGERNNRSRTNGVVEHRFAQRLRFRTVAAYGHRAPSKQLPCEAGPQFTPIGKDRIEHDRQVAAGCGIDSDTDRRFHCRVKRAEIDQKRVGTSHEFRDFLGIGTH
ncbi:MAG TPA: hypothetical protein VK862_01850 [Afifellaceae bacterium]|nr:hypothetical protein [Afifellaceae bacterium]